MTLLKLKRVIKKIYLYAKKFWWAVVLGLLFIIVVLLGAVTRNGAFMGSLLDLIDSKSEAHEAELKALEDIHNSEVAAKNARLDEHLKRKKELEEEFARRGEKLDRQKEKELKKLVDESYNDPEKLAAEIAKAFGL